MKILVVEDNAALSLFLRKGMETEGHQVRCVTDGEEAIAAAGEFGPELVILDLNLPRRDGIDVLRAVQGSSPGVSVLVLTGRASIQDRISCLDLGADDYLQKPFSFHELLARCRAVLRRRSTLQQSEVVHGDLRVDRLSRSVSVAGRGVELTSKEFALLDYLLQNAGRPVSRPELLEHVWKMSPDAGTNVVDVYVNYLRRKLGNGETSPENELIRTVRGAGYLIEPRGKSFDPKKGKPPASALPGSTQPVVSPLAIGAA